MDLDGDGIPDILSGSWPGQLYFFRGLGKGQFAAGEVLKDRGGRAIRLGPASTVFAVDWDGDGKLDLLVGHLDGYVYLVPNEAEGKKGYAFGKARKLQCAGKDIQVSHGDSHPVAVDWDRDGKLDLLVGTGAGSVLWYRNVGTKANPKLAAPQTLVPESDQNKNPGAPLQGNRPGVRAKICVVDWDGDGWPDLLVGDFSTARGAALKPTEADRKAQNEARQRLAEIGKELQVQAQAYQRLSRPVPGEGAEATRKREQQRREALQKLQELRRELEETTRLFRQSVQSLVYSGHVWLFRRQPPPGGKAGP